MGLTDQEEKDRYERRKELKAPRKRAENRLPRGHHVRMYRYHDQMARVVQKALNKSGNKELRRQYDYHVSRCKHHEKHIATQPPSDPGP